MNRRVARRRRIGFAGPGLAAVLVCVLWVTLSEEARLERLTGSTMGTSYAISYRPGPSAERFHGEIEAVLQELDDALSHWREEGWVARFNANESTEPMAAPEHAWRALRLSQDLAGRTDGAFDPTLGGVLALWGFGPGQADAPPPDEQAMQGAMAAAGWAKLHLQDEPPRVRKEDGRLALDLSGLAKGYAVDRLAEVLDRQGVEDYLINLGGDMRARGAPDKQEGWRVKIETPDAASAGEAYAELTLSGGALATSGDYRRFIEIDGERRPHVLDPATGVPVETHLASATVTAPTAAEADGLATACLVLGRQGAIELIESIPHAQVLLIERQPNRPGTFRSFTSAGWPGG